MDRPNHSQEHSGQIEYPRSDVSPASTASEFPGTYFRLSHISFAGPSNEMVNIMERQGLCPSSSVEEWHGDTTHP